MIHPLNLNIKDNKSIKHWLQYVEENDLAITETNCYMNSFIHKNKKIFGEEMDNNMKFIHCELGFRYFCDYWKSSKSKRLDERYREIICGHFVGERNFLKEEFLNEVIERYINKKKILFIVLDFIDYGLGDKDEYVPHACLLIMIPNGERYESFYINSHGKDMQFYKKYEIKISKKNKKHIIYENSVDMMFVDTFVKFMNKNHKVYIKYDFSDRHNYFGADYQSGDNYGICFIFPYIIWYYFGMYYNKQRIIYSKGEKYILKSNKEMLLKGDLIECIQGYLIDINKNYKNMYIKLLNSKKYNRKFYVNKLDNILYKSQGYFVKKILNIFIPFFLQENYSLGEKEVPQPQDV